MAAHSGKGSANGSGANPALDTDAAEELAANFKPSWAADDDDLPPGLGATSPAEPAAAPAPAPQAAVSIAPVVTISNSTEQVTASPAAAAAATAAATGATTAPMPAAAAPAAPHTQKMLGGQTVLGMGSPVRAPEPSSEALDSQNVIEVAPAPKSAAAQTLPASRGPASVATKPVTKNVVRSAPAVDPFKPSALDSDEFPQLKKSNKGLILGVIGVGIAVGLGLFLKFALSPDEPAKTTTAPPATTAGAKENDIPPPPPKIETATATPPPPTVAAKADPPPTPSPVEVKKPDPPPAAKAPDPPKTVAAAPPKTPKQPASPPPAAAPPKTPPKSTGGGIVRDSPF